MNSISSASSTRVAESLAYIGGSADAVALQEATQYYMTDKIRESLKKSLVNSGSLLQSLLQFNNLKARTSEYSSSTNLSITPQALINASNSADKLKNLFLNDGPKLGSTLEESQDLLEELLALGISMNAPLTVPVLLTTMDEDGKVLSSSFKNMSKAERDSLNSLNKIDAESAASDAREKVISPATKESSAITLRYEIFDNYANLRPEKNDVELAKILLAAKANTLRAQFSTQLTTVIKSGEKLESVIESHIKNAREQSIRVSESQVVLQQVVNELLQKLRLFKFDNEMREPNKGDLIVKSGVSTASDIGILAMIKNMSDRVESVSSLQNNAINISDINSSLRNNSPRSIETMPPNFIESNPSDEGNILYNKTAPLEFNKNATELIPKFLPGLVGDLPEPENLKDKYSDNK